MSDRGDLERDDGLPWGFIEDGAFIALPKLPLLRAGYGPPPFTVIMPDQRARLVVHPPGGLDNIRPGESAISIVPLLTPPSEANAHG